MLLILLGASFFPIPSFGYVDPGAGHLLLQMLIAGFVGTLFYIKKLVGFIGGLWKSAGFKKGNDHTPQNITSKRKVAGR